MTLTPGDKYEIGTYGIAFGKRYILLRITSRLLISVYKSDYRMAPAILQAL